jgi:hypothetical protein
MTRSIPSSHYSFCPIPSRHCIADRRLLSIIAKTALGNSNRIIELQTPHFVKRSESYTCKLPGGIGPNSLQTVRIVSRPSITRRARVIEDSASRATKNSGSAVSRQPDDNHARRQECKTMPLNQIESARLSASFSGLRDGPHCILSCFLGVVASCTASRTQLAGLAAVFAASGTFSGD